MIRYDRLWKTMEEKQLTQYRLIKQYGFSAGQIGRLKKNMHVSTHTIDILCDILQCTVSDIMEFLPDAAKAAPVPEAAVSASLDKPVEADSKEEAYPETETLPGEEKPEKETLPVEEKPEKEAPRKAERDKAAKTLKPEKAKAGKGEKAEKSKKDKGAKAEKSKKEKGEKEKGEKEKSEKKSKGGKKK